MYAKGDFTMLRKLFLLLVLFSSVVGCSRSPSYKGYVPVTQEEATAFAEQLVERTSQGDTSWRLEIAVDIDATAAVYSIAGIDIPIFCRNPSEQDRIEWKAMSEEWNKRAQQDLQEIRMKEIKEMGNTYIAVFDFVRKSGKTSENYITLLKKSDTGEIVMAGLGIKW
jgi:hypothetical protein